MLNIKAVKACLPRIHYKKSHLSQFCICNMEMIKLISQRVNFLQVKHEGKL
jgi:hypothetical protein